MILLCDFKVDFLSSSSFHKHSLRKTLNDLNIVQLAEDIIRPLSKMCLDHIWCSHPELINNAHILESAMSDHLPVATTMAYKRPQTNCTNTHIGDR